MNANRIKYELAEKGKKASDIAKELKVTQEAVSQTISRVMKSARIRKYICSIIEKPFDEVWGNDEEKTRNDRSQAER